MMVVGLESAEALSEKRMGHLPGIVLSRVEMDVFLRGNHPPMAEGFSLVSYDEIDKSMMKLGQ